MNQSGNKGSPWQIIYHPLVKRDIKGLSNKTALRIKLTIENKLSINPLYFGVPLRGTLKKYFKLRIGEWRVIYEIFGNKILIHLIANRKDIYQIARNRLG